MYQLRHWQSSLAKIQRYHPWSIALTLRGVFCAIRKSRCLVTLALWMCMLLLSLLSPQWSNEQLASNDVSLPLQMQLWIVDLMLAWTPPVSNLLTRRHLSWLIRKRSMSSWNLHFVSAWKLLKTFNMKLARSELPFWWLSHALWLKMSHFLVAHPDHQLPTKKQSFRGTCDPSFVQRLLLPKHGIFHVNNLLLFLLSKCTQWLKIQLIWDFVEFSRIVLSCVSIVRLRCFCCRQTSIQWFRRSQHHVQWFDRTGATNEANDPFSSALPTNWMKKWLWCDGKWPFKHVLPLSVCVLSHGELNRCDHSDVIF